MWPIFRLEDLHAKHMSLSGIAHRNQVPHREELLARGVREREQAAGRSTSYRVGRIIEQGSRNRMRSPLLLAFGSLPESHCAVEYLEKNDPSDNGNADAQKRPDQEIFCEPSRRF